MVVDVCVCVCALMLVRHPTKVHISEDDDDPEYGKPVEDDGTQERALREMTTKTLSIKPPTTCWWAEEPTTTTCRSVRAKARGHSLL